MNRPVRFLLVLDPEDEWKPLQRALERGGIAAAPERVGTLTALRDALPREEWSLVLAASRVDGFTVLDALRLAHDRAPQLPFLVLAQGPDEELAIEAMRRGARDYVMRERPARLPLVVERELQERARRMEAQEVAEHLRQAQKIEAVGRLAGGVAHDVNNMLSVVTGYSELLLMNTHGMPQKTRAALEEIRLASERATKLTRQLLTLSRRKPTASQAIAVNDLVSGMSEMFRRLLGEDVRLTTLLDPDLGEVRADPGHLEQILLNLVVNARDAMPRGGRLAIGTARVTLDAAYVARHPEARPGDYVMLSVTDTGCGMDAATQARIFEPFFTTKDPDKGTGLGLSTVARIVRESGGYVEVLSQPARGSTFRVYLPRMLEERELSAMTPGQATRAGRDAPEHAA